MADFVDLLIVDNDLVMDDDGEPVLIYDKDCIAQDVGHLIRDSGVMLKLLGERGPVAIAKHLHRLKLLIEADGRLVPGSITITTDDNETYVVGAKTYRYGGIELEVTA